jgi:hypothetical protein
MSSQITKPAFERLVNGEATGALRSSFAAAGRLSRLT